MQSQKNHKDYLFLLPLQLNDKDWYINPLQLNDKDW